MRHVEVARPRAERSPARGRRRAGRRHAGSGARSGARRRSPRVKTSMCRRPAMSVDGQPQRGLGSRPRCGRATDARDDRAAGGRGGTSGRRSGAHGRRPAPPGGWPPSVASKESMTPASAMTIVTTAPIPSSVMSVRRGVRRTLRSGRLRQAAPGQRARPAPSTRGRCCVAARAPTRIASTGVTRSARQHRQRRREQRAAPGRAPRRARYAQLQLEARATTGSGKKLSMTERARRWPPGPTGMPRRTPTTATWALRAGTAGARARAARRRAPCRCRSRGAAPRPCG